MIIAVILLLIALAISVFFLYKEIRPSNAMSFYESMNLVNLPILTFKVGNEPINFLFDSGMMQSTIDIRVLELLKLPYKKHDKTFSVYGITGNTLDLPSVLMDVEYKGTIYEGHFVAQDLSGSMDMIKQEYGVRIHGVIGTDFLSKYNYVIDFQRMLVYNKKSLIKIPVH